MGNGGDYFNGVFEMKLVTFKVHTEERLGAQMGKRILDLNSAYARYLKEVEGKDNARGVRLFRHILLLRLNLFVTFSPPALVQLDCTSNS